MLTTVGKADRTHSDRPAALERDVEQARAAFVATLYEVAARQLWADRACQIWWDALVCRVGQEAGGGVPAARLL